MLFPTTQRFPLVWLARVGAPNRSRCRVVAHSPSDVEMLVEFGLGDLAIFTLPFDLEKFLLNSCHQPKGGSCCNELGVASKIPASIGLQSPFSCREVGKKELLFVVKRVAD